MKNKSYIEAINFLGTGNLNSDYWFFGREHHKSIDSLFDEWIENKELVYNKIFKFYNFDNGLDILSEKYLSDEFLTSKSTSFEGGIGSILKLIKPKLNDDII